MARLPGSDSAELLSSSLAASVEMPAAGRSELIARLGALLVAESWGSGGSSEIEGGWRHTIGRRVIHVARDGEISTDLRAVGSPLDGLTGRSLSLVVVERDWNIWVGRSHNERHPSRRAVEIASLWVWA